MNQPIERELKLLIAKEQYEKIKDTLSFSDPFTQSNTYYDTMENTLKDRQCALRIRTISNKHIFTLKIKTDAITHIELEKEVDTDTLDCLNDPEIRFWCRQYDIPMKLRPIASFSTIRRTMTTEEATICLDANTFENGNDYELEYEYHMEHDGVQAFNELLKPYHLEYEKNCPSKLARAVSFYNL